MRLAISISSEFNDYTLFSDILNSIEFDEIVCLKHPIIEQYKKEYNKAVQTFDIKWDEIDGAQNIKQNRFGKMYNADAPDLAAQKVTEYATHVITFGNGDYGINRWAKTKNLTTVAGPPRPKALKRYKF